jgi:hypothetical protein
MQISPVQADTILAIGPTSYWDTKRQVAINGGWRLLKQIGGKAVYLEDRSSDTYLPQLIRECKSQWTGPLMPA